MEEAAACEGETPSATESARSIYSRCCLVEYQFHAPTATRTNSATCQPEVHADGAISEMLPVRTHLGYEGPGVQLVDWLPDDLLLYLLHPLVVLQPLHLGLQVLCVNIVMAS